MPITNTDIAARLHAEGLDPEWEQVNKLYAAMREATGTDTSDWLLGLGYDRWQAIIQLYHGTATPSPMPRRSFYVLHGKTIHRFIVRAARDAYALTHAGSRALTREEMKSSALFHCKMVSHGTDAPDPRIKRRAASSKKARIKNRAAKSKKALAAMKLRPR